MTVKFTPMGNEGSVSKARVARISSRSLFGDGCVRACGKGKDKDEDEDEDEDYGQRQENTKTRQDNTWFVKTDFRIFEFEHF